MDKDTKIFTPSSLDDVAEKLVAEFVRRGQENKLSELRWYAGEDKALIVDQILYIVHQRTRLLDNGCWEVSQRPCEILSGKPRGIVKIASVVLNANRVFYDILIGPVESGYKLLCDCGNKQCANPWHYSKPNRIERLARRFWPKVDKRGPDECWPWLAAKTGNRDGRGLLGWGDNLLIPAPRVSWEIHHGVEPPKDMFVCHSCDNGNCVNPAHLWLGTASDNMRDCARKHRNYFQIHPEKSFFKSEECRNRYAGRRITRSLTPEFAEEIKTKRASGRTLDSLAGEYKVGRTTICRAIDGKYDRAT